MTTSRPHQRRDSDARGVLLVALGAALWGSDAVFRRGLAISLPSSSLVFYEHLVLTALVLPILPRVRRTMRRFGPGDMAAALVIGVGSSATATMLFTAAFRYGDPTTPLLLQNLQPAFAVLGAAWLLRERPGRRFAAFFAASLGGAWLISFPDPAAVSVGGARASLLAVAAAVLWASGTVLGRHLLSHVPPTELMALRFSIGLPAAAVLVVIDQGSSGFSIAAFDLAAIVPLALVPGLAAILIYYRGLRTTPASIATLAELAFPLTAIVANRIFFGASLTTSQWAGVVVLTSSIVAMKTQAETRGPRGVGLDVGTPLRPSTAVDVGHDR